MRRLGSGILLLVCWLLAQATSAHAEKRVALVIGNSAYQHTGRLANPKNDATDMAVVLRKLGFHVLDSFDLDKAAFDIKVRDFAAALQGAEAGVFFFAGHGLQVAGYNYLVPVDAELKTASALDFEMVRLDVVQRVIEHETSTNILFLDACRDNPLARNLARALGTRSGQIGRGFAPVVSGVGTLISFSTQPGNVALDGRGRNSPFAGSLVKQLAAPKDDLSAILIDVRNDVMRLTQDKQVPWEHSALRGRFYFGPAPISAAPPPSPSPARLSEAAEAWDRTKDTQSVAALEAFIRRFGDTYYGDLAKVRVALLMQEEERKRTEEAGATKPGSMFRDCPDCPEMVVVPAGNFMMGSPPGEEGRIDSEGPQRKVTIARAFAVGKYEVTFAEWDSCVAAGGCTSNTRPSDQGWGRGRRPVINVSWDDAKEYAVWLSRTTGKTYRLLTEAEWEYAARGVTSASSQSKRYWWGDHVSHGFANYGKDQCCGGHKEGKDQWEYTAPVGQFLANPFGLHDMHGNVGEWVEDCWHDKYTAAPIDGSAWTTSCLEMSRVLRGGSWLNIPQFLRSAYRLGYLQVVRYGSLGFRVGRTLYP